MNTIHFEFPLHFLSVFNAIFQAQTIQVSTVSQQQYNALRDMDDSGFMSAFQPEDIQYVLIAPQSISSWTISAGSLSNLKSDLNSTTVPVSTNTLWSFTRNENTGVATTSSKLTSNLLSQQLQTQILNAILNDSKIDMTIVNLYPSFVHLTVNSFPAQDLPSAFVNTYGSVTLQHLSQFGNSSYWDMKQTENLQVCIPAIDYI
jgi:hypothetical protein